MIRFSVVAFLLCFVFSVASCGFAQTRYEMEPINYSRATPTDKVYQFSQNLKNGTESLEWDNQHGYLKSLLSKLKVPVSSQALVFSKTSLQVSSITPSHPRALYFNDDIYIGWVQMAKSSKFQPRTPNWALRFIRFRRRNLNDRLSNGKHLAACSVMDLRIHAESRGIS